LSLVVQKYGGSSLATPEYIKRVAHRVVEEKKNGNQIVVVVSALGDTTDHLTHLASQISQNPSNREMDMLLSVGERISIALLAMAIHDLGFEAISFTGSQVGIITDNKHTEAQILEVRATRLLEELQKGKIIIVAGFQGVSINKEITTLGRGGSDTTAIALAAALKADRCELMKDVNGIYISEPKLIPGARLNDELSYDEMIEMTQIGSGVLKNESVEIAKQHNVKIAVGSSFTGEIGTIITDRSLDNFRISGIVGKDGLFHLQVNTPVFPLKNLINKKFSDFGLKPQAYHLNQQRFDAVFQNKYQDKVLEIVEECKSDDKSFSFTVNHNKGMIGIIGSGLNFDRRLSVTLFEIIEDENLSFELLDISQMRITWIMPEAHINKTIKLLYQKFDINNSFK